MTTSTLNRLSDLIREDADAEKRSNEIVLSVQDTGEGIAPERKDKIFEKLESDSTEEGALGLGLAIVSEIVRAHGGSVSVESIPGDGSTFRFTLPV